MIDDSDIPVTVRKRRGLKALRLCIRDDGSVTLSVPWRLPSSTVRDFLSSKKDWIVSARKRMSILPARLLNQGSREEYQARKEEARKRVLARVEYFQSLYEVAPSGISVRNQRSRFGSCSARGHLSFNYRLLFLPPALLDYVVVHELCHLRELNHSPRFWALVAETIPEYRKRKRELQTFSRASD